VGQIPIFHFVTQKGTSLRDSASFEPLCVKIRPDSVLCTGPKKINKKSYKKVIFHPIAQWAPVNGFSPTLLWNNISSRRHNQSWQICVNLFKGFDFTGVKILIILIGN